MRRQMEVVCADADLTKYLRIRQDRTEKRTLGSGVLRQCARIVYHGISASEIGSRESSCLTCRTKAVTVHSSAATRSAVLASNDAADAAFGAGVSEHW